MKRHACSVSYLFHAIYSHTVATRVLRQPKVTESDDSHMTKYGAAVHVSCESAALTGLARPKNRAEMDAFRASAKQEVVCD